MDDIYPHVIYYEDKNEDDCFNCMIELNISDDPIELAKYIDERMDLGYTPIILSKKMMEDEVVEVVIKKGPYNETIEQPELPKVEFKQEEPIREPSPERKRSPSPKRRSPSPKREESPPRERYSRTRRSPSPKKEDSPPRERYSRTRRSPSPKREESPPRERYSRTRRSPSPKKEESPPRERYSRTRRSPSPKKEDSPPPRRSPSPKIDLPKKDLKVIKETTLEEDLDEWETKRRELNNLQERRRQRRRELYQQYLAQQKEYKSITELLKQYSEKSKDYSLYALPKLLLIGVDQSDDDMRDLIEENDEILKTCTDIMEENKLLIKYETYELLDYLKEDN